MEIPSPLSLVNGHYQQYFYSHSRGGMCCLTPSYWRKTKPNRSCVKGKVGSQVCKNWVDEHWACQTDHRFLPPAELASSILKVISIPELDNLKSVVPSQQAGRNVMLNTPKTCMIFSALHISLEKFILGKKPSLSELSDLWSCFCNHSSEGAMFIFHSYFSQALPPTTHKKSRGRNVLKWWRKSKKSLFNFNCMFFPPTESEVEIQIINF